MNFRRYKNIFLTLIVVAFFVVIVVKFGELKNIVELLTRSIWYFIAIAFLLQIVAFFNQAALYSALYKLVEVKEPYRNLVGLLLSSQFVNIVAPSSGISGIAYFVHKTQKRGIEAGKSILVNILFYFVFDYISTLVFLAAGLIYLFFHGGLYLYQIFGASILLAIVGVVLIVFAEVIHNEERFLRFVRWILNFCHRIFKFFKKNFPISADRGVKVAKEVFEGIGLTIKNRADLFQPIMFVIFKNLLSLLVLYFVFLAFGWSVHLGVLIAGWGIGILFIIISITPMGVGVVETVMTLVFVSLGVPLETAALVTLVYRLFTFWLPFFFGFLAIRFPKVLESVGIE